MKKVIQKLAEWRDIWANTPPFAEFSTNRRPYTFGDFMSLASLAIVNDGGSFDEFHGIFSFPPSVTKRGWVEISKEEIFEKIWQ